MAAKPQSRLAIVAVNILRNLTLPAANILVSLLVIAFTDKAFWGGFVEYLIFVGLAAHFVNWGNKEFLLRKFSQAPSTISSSWQSSFVSRSLLAALPIALFFVIYSAGTATWLSIWLLGMIGWQSFDVVVAYSRRYWPAIIAEVLHAFFLIGAIAYFNTELSVLHIIQFFAFGALFKAVFLAIWLGNEVGKESFFKFDASYYGAAFFFFMIGMSGLLQSKTDLYVVNFMLTRTEIGEYQVIINLFIWMQALAGFVLMPFARNLYRAPDATSHKIALKLSALGLGILALGIPCVFILLSYGYNFDLTWDYYLYGALFVFPSFCYLPYILVLYKHEQESRVLLINIIGAVVNLAFTYWLLHEFKGKGALMGSAIAQWVLLGIYLFMTQRKGHDLKLENAD